MKVCSLDAQYLVCVIYVVIRRNVDYFLCNMNCNREDVIAYCETGFAVFVLVTIQLCVKGMTDLTLIGSFSVSLRGHRRGLSCCG
jgi:protein tyrosine phosphatase (PTP) superfamily phosphohydrolase (DUF442 family)